MNRRGFIGGLLGVAVGELILPEPKRVRAYSFLPGDVGHISNDLRVPIDPRDFFGWDPVPDSRGIHHFEATALVVRVNEVIVDVIVAPRVMKPTMVAHGDELSISEFYLKGTLSV